MSDKFRKIVNAPHKFAGRVRRAVKDTAPQSASGKATRVAGIGTVGFAQFLLWLTKYVTLDNHALRGMENYFKNMTVGKNKQGKDKKVSAFAKKYPNLSSHILYYSMMAGLVLGGAKYLDNDSTAEEGQKQNIEVVSDIGAEYLGNDSTAKEGQTQNIWLVSDIGADEIRVKPNTYGAYLARMQGITPYLFACLVAEEGVRVNSDGMHVPYRDSKNIPTMGFGSTILRDGSSVRMDSAPITTDEAYELSCWHIEDKETFLMMYAYDVMYGTFDVNSSDMALGLADVIYNSGTNLIENPNDKNHCERMTLLRADFEQYGYDLPDSLIRQRFAEFPVRDTRSFGDALLRGKSVKQIGNTLGNFIRDGKGLQWRRWLEAGLMNGDINPQMLLDCPANGMSEFYYYMGTKPEYGGEPRKAFIIGSGENRQINRKTYADFVQWLQNPVDKHGKSMTGWKKVRDWMPADVVKSCERGECTLQDGNMILKNVKPRQTVLPSIGTENVEQRAKYDGGIAAFRAGDFAGAVTVFEELVAVQPNNASLRNDLAATYNGLGRYDDAIAQVRHIIKVIKDSRQYGAAYYNAGVSYEKMGNMQRALANYKLAVANGNKKVQADVDRLSMQESHGRDKQTLYKPASGKVKQNPKQQSVNKTKTQGKSTKEKNQSAGKSKKKEQSTKDKNQSAGKSKKKQSVPNNNKSKKTNKGGKTNNKSKKLAFEAGINKAKKNAFIRGLALFNESKNLG